MLIRKLWFLKKALKQQWMKPEELKKLQEKKLRAIIRHAYKNIPFYKKKWKKIGIKPDDIKTVEDLRKLPIITREEIKKNWRDIIARNMGNSKYILRSTSGSSGVPLKVLFDEKAWDFLDAIYARALFAAGYRPWDKLAYYWFPPFNKTKFYELLGIMKKHWMVYTIPEEKQIERLKKINPDVIYCFPSTLYLLGKMIIRNGIDSINPRIIISHGEILTEEVRKFIETAFGAEVFDQYGSTEFNRMGWECKMHEGLHIDVDSIVLEVIEFEGREQVSTGERGNVVVTGLVNRLMPFIRYKIGDIGILSDDNCQCNRAFPLLEKIEGRQDDFIVLPSGKIIAPRSIVHLIMNITGIWKFKVLQKKKDKIEIRIVKDKKFSKNTISEIKRRMKKIIAESVDIDIKVVDDIPRNKHGKLKAIESKIKI